MISCRSGFKRDRPEIERSRRWTFKELNAQDFGVRSSAFAGPPFLRKKGAARAFYLVSERARWMIVIPPAKNHLLSLAPDDFIARP